MRGCRDRLELGASELVVDPRIDAVNADLESPAEQLFDPRLRVRQVVRRRPPLCVRRLDRSSRSVAKRDEEKGPAQILLELHVLVEVEPEVSCQAEVDER
jgi:hypothetical protein